MADVIQVEGEVQAVDLGGDQRVALRVHVVRGAMLPKIEGSLPDFVPVFDPYAADLAKACKAA